MKFAKISLAVTLAVAASCALAQTFSIPTPADSATPGGQAVVAISPPGSVPFSSQSGQANTVQSWSAYFPGQNKPFATEFAGTVWVQVAGGGAVYINGQYAGIPTGNGPVIASVANQTAGTTTVAIGPTSAAYLDGPPNNWGLVSVMSNAGSGVGGASGSF